MSIAARTNGRPSVGDQADRPVCRDGLPWMPPAYRDAVLQAAHTLDGFLAILGRCHEMAGITDAVIDLRERMATCPLPSHGGHDEHPSLSFAGREGGRLWRCMVEGIGGDGLHLLADVGGWPREDHRRSVFAAGDAMGIPRPGVPGGRDPVAAWQRIERRHIAERQQRARCVEMPMAVQAAAFGALLDACDAAAPRGESAAFDHLLRVRGIPSWAAERCGPVRLLSSDELAAVSVMLASGPDAAICEAAGILGRDRDGSRRLAWRDDSLLLFHAAADLSSVLYCGGRRIGGTEHGGRYRMPHGHGAALPPDLAPASETIEVRDCYAADGTTRSINRPLMYRPRPVLYGLPQVGEAATAGKLLIVEGALKAQAAVAMGHCAVAPCCALGWSPDTDHARRADSALGTMIDDLAGLIEADISVVPDHDRDVETRARMAVLAESLADALRLGHGLRATARSMADIVGADRVGPQPDGDFAKDFDEVLRSVGPIPASDF